ATLIDNLGLHSFSVRSGEVLLDAGWHHVRIRYQDMGGGAMMRFWRKPAGGESEALPAGSLRPEAS
ncbi:MAG TPA: hypothetical protein VL688_00605, partial [Verrucomicrobiae bacterium]|nr:hypothetical protein [Verrucomicrobiae bacterium]